MTRVADTETRTTARHTRFCRSFELESPLCMCCMSSPALLSQSSLTQIRQGPAEFSTAAVERIWLSFSHTHSLSLLNTQKHTLSHFLSLSLSRKDPPSPRGAECSAPPTLGRRGRGQGVGFRGQSSGFRVEGPSPAAPSKSGRASTINTRQVHLFNQFVSGAVLQ